VRAVLVFSIPVRCDMTPGQVDVQGFMWVVGAYTDADAPSEEIAEAERRQISEEILRHLAHDRTWINTGARFEPLTSLKST